MGEHNDAVIDFGEEGMSDMEDGRVSGGDGRRGGGDGGKSDRYNGDASDGGGRTRNRSRSPGAGGGGHGNSNSDGNENPGNNLYVSGLAPRTKDEDLEKVFERFGKITKCAIMYDPHTKDSRGFAFVSFDNVEAADEARESIHQKLELHGKIIRVEKAKRARARDPTPGEYHGPPKRDEFRRREMGGGGRGGDRYDDRRYDDRRYDDRGGRYDDRRYDDRRDYDRYGDRYDRYDRRDYDRYDRRDMDRYDRRDHRR